MRAAFLILTLASPAAAQTVASARLATTPAMSAGPCPTTPPKLSPDLSGWSTAAPLAAAATPRELGAATLTIGQGARATLRPSADVAFALQPEHPPIAGTSSGLFAFTVTQAGRYRIALGGTAWVDVVRDGRSLATSGHGHGPDCTGIRKIVDYQLEPGRYTLQISGSASATLQLMAARLAI